MKLSAKRSIRIKKSKKQSRKHDKKGKYKVKRTRITMRRRALDLKNKSLKRKKMKGGTKTTRRSGSGSKIVTTKKGSSPSQPRKFHTKSGTLKRRPARQVKGTSGEGKQVGPASGATPVSPRAKAFLARQKQKEEEAKAKEATEKAKAAKEAKAATKTKVAAAAIKRQQEAKAATKIQSLVRGRQVREKKQKKKVLSALRKQQEQKWKVRQQQEQKWKASKLKSKKSTSSSAAAATPTAASTAVKTATAVPTSTVQLTDTKDSCPNPCPPINYCAKMVPCELMNSTSSNTFINGKGGGREGEGDESGGSDILNSVSKSVQIGWELLKPIVECARESFTDNNKTHRRKHK